MSKIKEKIIRLENVNSLDDFLFQICNQLKMKGWQFDNLTIEEKIVKWLSRNTDKKLRLEIYKESILKKIEELQSRIILTSKAELPEGYEIGNPHNRWIHNDPIIRTQEQIEKDNKKIKSESDKEYNKIRLLLESIEEKCGIQVVRK